jgi:hypothetical protein
MKNTSSLYILILLLLFIGACKKDNKEPPDAKITGRVVYNGQPVGLRSNGVQLELWQPGYNLFTKIPVYVAQDGTFSVAVFGGAYKLTRLRGNGPWADNVDTIDVQVNGSTNVDVPIDPYFIITNASIQKSGTNITATFNLQRVNTTKNLELVKLYVGRTTITDQNLNDVSVQKLAAAIPDLNQPVSLSVSIPASLANAAYLFARIGVKTVSVGEYLYTIPVKIQLN